MLMHDQSLYKSPATADYYYTDLLQSGVEKLLTWADRFEPTTLDLCSRSQVPVTSQPRQHPFKVNQAIKTKLNVFKKYD